MIGEIASFSNALANAFSNTFGGKATQLGSWRHTLRYSSSLALVFISVVILFNLNSITSRVLIIGFAAGFCGGLGLPFIYKAISTGAVSFIAPVVGITQSMFLIIFAVVVKGEQLSASFPIAAALGAIGIFLCSRQASGNQNISIVSFLLSITAATFFSGYSLMMTEIQASQILAALFGARVGVLSLTFIFPPTLPQMTTKPITTASWRKFALLSGLFEVLANIFFILAITNLELNKVGIFLAFAPALSVLIAIKLLHQKPSTANWLGIGASTGALAVIALA
jgi:drug/metabolite transporter (DMT)-like permease